MTLKMTSHHGKQFGREFLTILTQNRTKLKKFCNNNLLIKSCLSFF